MRKERNAGYKVTIFLSFALLTMFWPSHLTLYSIDTHFDISTTENIVGKGEIAYNEQFLLSPQCFLLNQVIVSPIVQIFDIISLSAAELEEPKLDKPGKGLNFRAYDKRSRTLLTFPKQQILDFSKLKEFADDNFKFDENGRKFSKLVENNV